VPSQRQRPAPRAEEDAELRLVYITVSLPYGPGETFFIPEITELLRKGCDLLIVPRSPRGAVVNRDAAGLEHISLRRPILSPGILAAAACEVLRHPLRCLRACGLLLHSRNAVTLLKNLLVYPKALWLGRLARAQGVDHIHAQWASTTATMAMVASELSGVPWSCTAHRGDIAMNNLLRQKLARARFVRFISESGLCMAEELGANPRQHDAPMIHGGVSLPAALPPAAAAAGPLRLLCPANLLPVKGHQYLLQALAILRDRRVDCRLLIAGRGELKTRLENMAQDLSIQGMVQFLGQVPHDALLAMYTRGEIGLVVLPSVDLGNNLHEGIPVALVEAMGHGIPVLATRTGGIPELLHDGAGIMVPPKDPAVLADAMESLIRDAGLRQRLAAAGRARVREGWALDAVVARFLARLETARNQIAAEPSREDGIGCC